MLFVKKKHNTLILLINKNQSLRQKLSYLINGNIILSVIILLNR